MPSLYYSCFKRDMKKPCTVATDAFVTAFGCLSHWRFRLVSLVYLLLILSDLSHIVSMTEPQYMSTGLDFWLFVACPLFCPFMADLNNACYSSSITYRLFGFVQQRFMISVFRLSKPCCTVGSPFGLVSTK